MDRRTISTSLAVLLGIAVLGCLITLKSNPSLLQFNKQPGSFEYVRKGEASLDAGDYSAAIRHFEKAYELSPDNPEIASYLVWAYMKSGTALLADSKFDASIDIFTKAYDAKKSGPVAQNLAAAYVKRAYDGLKKGDSAAAYRDFLAARELVSEWNNAARNLAIVLFNEAVGEFKAGREENALRGLKESLLIDENIRALDLAGDIYYRLNDRDQALFYWERALIVEPENTEIMRKRERTLKEMLLAQAERKRELPHFELRYNRDLKIDEKRVSDALEKAYFDVGERFGYFPKEKTVVFLYSPEEFKSIFKLPEAVRAFYDGNIRIPLPAKGLEEKETGQYIYHEYAHAVVSALTENNCPVWFSEGLAVWSQLNGQDFAVVSTVSKMVDQSTLSIGAIDGAFRRSSTESLDMRIYYLEAYTVVKYILEQWGVGGVRALLKRMRAGQHVINAIDDEFLLSEKDFDSRWRMYVMQTFFKVQGNEQAVSNKAAK